MKDTTSRETKNVRELKMNLKESCKIWNFSLSPLPQGSDYSAIYIANYFLRECVSARGFDNLKFACQNARNRGVSSGDFWGVIYAERKSK